PSRARLRRSACHGERGARGNRLCRHRVGSGTHAGASPFRLGGVCGVVVCALRWGGLAVRVGGGGASFSPPVWPFAGVVRSFFGGGVASSSTVVFGVGLEAGGGGRRFRPVGLR